MFALRIPPSLDSVPAVTAFVWAVTTELDVPTLTAYRLRLAVDEIITNIIEHGYLDRDQPEPINIWAESSPGTISITIEDGGPPFDMTTATPPHNLDDPLDTREVGGLGVFLVQSYVDDLTYRRTADHNVNVLTIRFVTDNAGNRPD